MQEKLEILVCRLFWSGWTVFLHKSKQKIEAVDVAAFKKAFSYLKLHVPQLATSKSPSNLSPLKEKTTRLIIIEVKFDDVLNLCCILYYRYPKEKKGK